MRVFTHGADVYSLSLQPVGVRRGARERRTNEMKYFLRLRDDIRDGFVALRQTRPVETRPSAFDVSRRRNYERFKRNLL